MCPESQDPQSSSPANGGSEPAAQAQATTPTDRASELEAQIKEEKNRYLYLYADFENFKKRTLKERSDLIKFGWENVARDLLMVLDNLERALSHIPSGTDKNLTDGLQMIVSQFRGTLERQGVQTIQAVGQPFDPNLHEATGKEASTLPADAVVREEIKGYLLHGRLLRPTRVVVSAGPAS